jgi:hypothetical protein
MDPEMKNNGPLKLSPPTRDAVAPHGRACPRCHSAVFNVSRRLTDLILSLFTPVRRYRCISMKCSWEGTLREKKSRLAETVGVALERVPEQTGRTVAHPVRIRPAGVLQETRS